MDIKLQAVKRAVDACGTQAELARRLSEAMGKEIKGGHIYYWLKNGVAPDDAPAFEIVTAGVVQCQELAPDVEWQRDVEGKVTGYVVSVKAA